MSNALFAAALITFGETGQTVQPAPSSYVALPGFESARANTGVAIHQIDDAKLLDAVKDAGFSFVRTDLFWEAVRAPDGWHFDGFDGLVNNLSARRLGALFILGYKHRMYSPDQPPTSPGQLVAFQSYVYQAVHRYRNAPVRFEVWNEEDDAKYWLAPPSPTAYRALLETAVRSAKSANPQVSIGTGGVQQINRAFIHAVGDMSADMPVGEAREGPDAVSVHPYRQEEPETVLHDYRTLRGDLSGYVKRPVVWATELSYPSVGYRYVRDINDGHSPEARARQARYAVRLLLMNWISEVKLTSYYDMRDDGNDPKEMEHNFGLLDASNKPLPAYQAVKHLFSFTSGSRARYSINEKQHYVVLQLTDVRARRFVMWCYGEGNAIDVDFSALPGNTRITDLYGASIEQRQMTLRETQGPVFITFALPTSATKGTEHAR
nr:glycosyl hydrolase family 5 [Caballeronia sp. AZ10_KS36]